MIQLYVNVDDLGNITGSYSGKDIVVKDQYDFFFMVEQSVPDNIHLYKVQVVDFTPSLVLI